MNFNTAFFEKAFGTFEQLGVSDLPEFCFSGRSNVGKSSLINKLSGKKAAFRVHGGGFAGTIQAFVPMDVLDEFKDKICAVFGEKSCYVLNIRPEGGVKVL